ncbi:hypothetical protein [Pectobacterium brasiliense]|uniref:hypothetical protein n=1 Tax=Pectobacterium brasiliense TaxID=180957 RepID=UPI003BB08EA8
MIIFTIYSIKGSPVIQTLAEQATPALKTLPRVPQDFITHRLPPTALSPSIFLGVVGTPGRSAYFGMNKIAKPKSGETQVVSAASGGVGSVVGQLGKQAGCRGERAVKISREHY